MSYPINNDAELLAHLKAKQETIPFPASIIASTTSGYIVCDDRSPRSFDPQWGDTIDGAIEKANNLNKP